MGLPFPGVAAGATDAPSDPSSITPAIRAEVVAEIRELIGTRYVHADEAAAISSEIEASLAAGRYDAYDRALDFAGALTADLQAHDLHFAVHWSPPATDVASPNDHEDEGESSSTEYARLNNHGFERVARLPGNLGYLDLRFFDDPEAAGDTAVGAMAVLANTDAVLIDLRQNGGGEPGMVQLLISYFLPGRVHYNGLYWRESDSTEQLWSLPHVAGRRRPDVPLWILTSARTGSAAEAFAYSLQALDRAEIVGERTVGAANPGDGFPLSHGFDIFVSTGAAVNPITGTSWEHTGVQPDLEVPSDEALDTARLAALRHLLSSAESALQRRELQWAVDAIEIARHPVALDAETLAAYPGTYGGRVVRSGPAGLTYRRGRRVERAMIPLGEDVFLVEGLTGFRTRFERDAAGGVVRMVDQWVDGHESASVRE